jgi:peptidyl-prolyl cis-trans isomerase D
MLDNGDVAVVQITGVEDGEVSQADADGSSPGAEVLAQLLGRQAYEAMLGDIERRAKVERRPVKSGPDL